MYITQNSYNKHKFDVMQLTIEDIAIIERALKKQTDSHSQALCHVFSEYVG